MARASITAETLGPQHQALLAARVRAGDAAAEEELVGLFQKRILAMMVARTRDPEAARDLTQEVLMAVVLALRHGRLLAGEKLAAFVHGTARNVVNAFFRSRPRQALPLSAEIDRADPAADPEEVERTLEAKRLLDALDPMDRRILRLTLFEGLKPGEIAAAVRLSPEVVRARKTRAVKKLLERLAGASRTAARPPHEE